MPVGLFNFLQNYFKCMCSNFKCILMMIV